MRIAIAAAVTVAALTVPPCARAQSRMPSTLPPVGPGQTLTINPIGMTLRWFNVEYERRATNTTTWGVVGSTWDLGFGQYRSLRLLARYHPQEAAPSGFYVGVQGGLHALGDEIRPGIGVEFGETWLLGSDERFSFGSGIGVIRVLGVRGDLVVPTVRLNVGVAF